MKRITLIIVSLLLLLCLSHFEVQAQTVDAEYLNPKLGVTTKFIRFGTSSEYFGGFMWNDNYLDYGNGDDFSIFTYADRDIVLQANSGNIIMFPNAKLGKVGIGTVSPEAKFQVNADPGIEAFRLDYYNATIDFRTRASFKGNGFFAYGLYNINEGGEPRFTFRRARGASFETPSAVQLHDKLGAIYWDASNDNGEYRHAAGINVIAVGTQTNGATPARIDFDTTPEGSDQQFPSTRMTIQHNGMVGIGTTNPETLLEIYSETSVAPIRMTSNRPGGADSYLDFKNKASTNPNTVLGLGLWGSMDGAFIVRLGDGSTVPEEKFRITTNGNVGIGTMFPGEYKLAVNGNVRVREITVSQDDWSDFVFEKDYSLPTLSEVEEHIKENKHLPGIPSAAEVESNGVNLGEMDAKLLQKIEELTLYIIQQNKRIEELEKKVNRQE